MKIQKKSKQTTVLLLAALLAVAAIAAGGYYFYTQNQAAEREKANASDAVNPQSKQDIVSSKDSKDADPTKSTAEIPINEAASITISEWYQHDGQVSFTGTFSGIEDGGTCSAQYSNGEARPITRTTAAKNMTCGPVSIPEVEFTQTGSWTLTLRYYKADKQAVATKVVEIQ